jgi:hypothetical protein
LALVELLELLTVVGYWYYFRLFRLVLRAGCWRGSYFLLELLHPTGGVLIEAGLSAVGLVVALGLDEAGHFVCCWLLFLLLLKVCTASLYWFGLDYSLFLVAAVPDIAVCFNNLVLCD